MFSRVCVTCVVGRSHTFSWPRALSGAPMSLHFAKRFLQTLPDLPLFRSLVTHQSNVAVSHTATRQQYTYRELLSLTSRYAGEIQKLNLPHGSSICVLVHPSLDYCAATCAIWATGNVAVPLCTTHPASEIDYVVTNSQCKFLIAHPSFVPILTPIAKQHCLPLYVPPEELPKQAERLSGGFTEVNMQDPSLIIYTSGTTGRPKGVVHTHASVYNQVRILQESWGWTPKDHILSLLPLHHTHGPRTFLGVANVVFSALHSGAHCEFMEWNGSAVWNRIAEPQSTLSLFMAVPTIYAKLLDLYRAQPKETQTKWTNAFARFRLLVSGSAAMSDTIKEQFEALSKQQILERYGMTEAGMILSQPLNGPRLIGTVGHPLPTVECKVVPVVAKDGSADAEEHADASLYSQVGELLMRSPSLFKWYLNMPEATAEAFTKDGWFKTGDTVGVMRDAPHDWKILGRTSVDIIKTSGYKVSAIDIESILLKHPLIAEVAVVGVPDPTYGQKVGALVALNDPKAKLSLEELRNWCRDKLAPYRTPTQLVVLDAIPRNAMGKVNKKSLVPLFQKK